MIKKVRVGQAEGLVLAHDVAGKQGELDVGIILPKGRVLRKSDVITLLGAGVERVYVTDGIQDDVNEVDASARLASAFSGSNVHVSDVEEGRINFLASCDGILKINTSLLSSINSIDGVVLFTLHNNSICSSDMVVAGTKIIPASIPESVLLQVEELCGNDDKVISVKPFTRCSLGVIVVGDNSADRSVSRKYSSAISSKAGLLGANVVDTIAAGNDEEAISEAILVMLRKGVGVILICGGLSVNPNHVTLEGIVRSGATIVSSGVPVMPGSMSVVAYLDNVPLIGVPSCFLRNKATVVDVLLARSVAGDIISKIEIASLGHGGMCTGCKVCAYPNCSFLK